MITVLTHERPDGDAVGAALGLVAAIRAGGGEARAYLWGAAPRWFPSLHAALGGPAYETGPYAPLDGERVALVDAGDPVRCGAALGTPPPLALIVDHHDNPPAAADVVIRDPQATSACDLIVQRWDDLAQALGVALTLTPQAASWLALGIRTDTLDLSVPGVDEGVLRRLGRLADAGADLARIAQVVRRSATSAHLDLQCELWLARRVVGDAALFVASADLLAAAGVSVNDAKMVLTMASLASDVDLAVLAVEDREAGKVRVSIRSATPGRALTMARAIGGGGHGEAAGAVVARPLDDVVAGLQAVLEAGA